MGTQATSGSSSKSLLLARRVLVIKFLGIGDVLFTTPMLRALRKYYPHLHVSYLTSPLCAPVLQTNPNVDEIIVHEPPSKNAGELFALIGSLRKKHFDAVIICHRSFPAMIFAWCIGAPLRIGFDYKRWGFLLNYKVKLEKNKFAPRLYMELLKDIRFDDLDLRLEMHVAGEDKVFASDILGDFGASAIIAIAPGGGTNAWMDMSRKRWTVDGFVEVIRAIPEHCKVLLLGGNEDIPISRSIKEKLSDHVIDMTGKTTLKQAAALIARAKVFVGIDSSLLHIASAVGVPTVSLFGPTNPEFFAPKGAGHDVVMAEGEIQCRPCFDYKKLPECHNHVCMNLIRPKQVLASIETHL